MQNESSNDQIILQTSEGGVYVTQEGDGGGETVLTLDSAVQEAVASGATIADEGTEEAEEATEDGQQMVAQIVQAEPPTPGGMSKNKIFCFNFEIRKTGNFTYDSFLQVDQEKLYCFCLMVVLFIRKWMKNNIRL